MPGETNSYRTMIVFAASSDEETCDDPTGSLILPACGFEDEERGGVAESTEGGPAGDARSKGRSYLVTICDGLVRACSGLRLPCSALRAPGYTRAGMHAFEARAIV